MRTINFGWYFFTSQYNPTAVIVKMTNAQQSESVYASVSNKWNLKKMKRNQKLKLTELARLDVTYTGWPQTGTTAFESPNLQPLNYSICILAYFSINLYWTELLSIYNSITYHVEIRTNWFRLYGCCETQYNIGFNLGPPCTLEL